LPKSISAGLDTHLGLVTTTLATCWRITRTDKVEFFFTDHDKNILFGGNTYLASAGYTRTAIENDSSLSVDNLDVIGIFDSASITEADVIAGKFDYAEIRIFVVNWNDLTQLDLKMRRGWFGEVIVTESGFFRAELRGLAQAYSQNILKLYAPECRTDLGSKLECKVPLNPSIVGRLTAYSIGDNAVEADYVRVPTGSESSNIPITNPGWDTGDLTGWTTNSGTPGADTVEGDLIPQSGSHFLRGNAVEAAYELEQVVDVSGAPFNTTKIDNGEYRFDFNIYRANAATDADDTGLVTIDFLDTSSVLIKNAYTSPDEVIIPSSTWVKREIENVAVPANTRKIRIKLGGTRSGSGQVMASFDTCNGAMYLEGYTEFENRIYECTTSGETASTQPVYDETVGNTTTDGTVVFTARQAWTRHATVATVTDRAIFTITVTETRGVDDWFNLGAVIWETGNNKGAAMEVRDWVDSTDTITLFLKMPFNIQVGDLLRLYPGCDKRAVEACRDKFVIASSKDFANGNIKNFRGEPYVPGIDSILNYPNAK